MQSRRLFPLSILFNTRSKALLAIVERYIATGRKEKSLTTARLIANPSRRAVAILKVAAAHARDGDDKTAIKIAERIQLKATPIFLLPNIEGVAFDFSNAETWGATYDQRPYFSMVSYSITVDRTQELAAAAMTLAQALNESRDLDYAVLFKKVRFGEVIQSLARVHAANGDAREALAWASRIGSDQKIASKDDHDTRASVEHRIHALIGVAEGLLEK